MESIRVLYKVQTSIEASGLIRDYEFTHPYGAPAEEAFHALETIRSQIEMRVAEIHNSQLAAQVQQPAIVEPTTEESTQGVSNGN